jgi:hypothetical protein
VPVDGSVTSGMIHSFRLTLRIMLGNARDTLEMQKLCVRLIRLQAEVYGERGMHIEGDG